MFYGIPIDIVQFSKKLMLIFDTRIKVIPPDGSANLTIFFVPFCGSEFVVTCHEFVNAFSWIAGRPQESVVMVAQYNPRDDLPLINLSRFMKRIMPFCFSKSCFHQIVVTVK